MIILVILSFIVILFLFFKQDVYQWSCEQENNSASCYFAGIESKKQKDYVKAKKFLNLSCSLNYGLGCWEYYRILKEQGFIEDAQSARIRACELDTKILCEEEDRELKK